MEELNFKELISVLWKKKWVVLIIILLVTFIGGIYSYYFIEPKYQSSTTLILGRINSSSDNVSSDNSEQITQSEISINSNLVSTYSELIKSKSLIQKVIDNLKIDIDEEILKKSITVSRIAETELIEIDVVNEDSEVASKIANEIANVFSNKIEEIYNISNVYIIDKAIPSSTPYNINHVKDISLAFVLSIILAGGYIIICYLCDNTIKNASDIEKTIGLKNLISIPIEKNKKFGKKNKKTELITFLEPKSVVSEAFRTLRTNVQFSNTNAKDNKTFLISSCFPGEGKSYISANLAITFAQIGKKVILVDSDMRRGRQSKVFNMPNVMGLSNYISNLDENGIEINKDLGKFIHETNIQNLNLITAGTVPPNPSELLSSPKLQEMIEILKKYYDVVIFDGAPILPITDSLILARLLNSTIIVTHHNKTKKEDLQKVKANLEAVGGKIIGICINCVPINEYGKDKYYYYKPEEKKPKKEKLNYELKAMRLRTKRNINKLCHIVKAKINREKPEIIEALPEYKPNNRDEIISEREKNKFKQNKIKIQREQKELKVKNKNEKLKNKEIKNEKAEKTIETKNKEKQELHQKLVEEKKIEQERKIEQKSKEDEALRKQKEIEQEFKQKEKEEKQREKEEKQKNKEQELERKRKEKEEKQKIKEQELENIKKEKEEKNNQKVLIKETRKQEQSQKRKELLNKIKENSKNIFEKSKTGIKSRVLKIKEKNINFIKNNKEKFEEIVEIKAKEKQEKQELHQKLVEEKKIEQERKLEQKSKEDEELKKQKEIAQEFKQKEKEEKQKEKEEKQKIKEQELERKRKEKEEKQKIKEQELENIKKEKEKEKEEAKYTEEYLEENLYPKTKNTKLF